MMSIGDDTDEPILLESVANALLALSNVALGDYETRIEHAADDASTIGKVSRGINEMIGALAAEEARSAAYVRELEEKLEMIEHQRAVIRELSTPILEIWDGVLCLPIIGVMDTLRSETVTNALLRGVTDLKADYVIVDITGIEVMDTRTVDHLVRMAKSVRLLGAQCALTGLNPNIAQTVVHMGVDLDTIATHRSLRDALVKFVGPSAVG